MKTHQHNSLPSFNARPIYQIHFRWLKGWAFSAWLGLWVISSQPLQAQPVETLWLEGIRLEKRNEDVLALEYFMRILQSNPGHPGALCKASKLYSRLGGRSEIKSEKKEMMLKAKSLACEAIHTDNQNADAHFQYILALGMLSEIADNPKDKLESARIIKNEAEIILLLDSNNAGAYYVLGKWNAALSGLNWFERFIGQTLLGGIPPGASYAEALRLFQHAIDLQPGCILFYYGMAKTLADHGQNEEAMKNLEKALLLPMLEPDDQIRKEKCKRLVAQIRK
jgi:tetratricopeptide (TPR) repeat protein